MPKSLYFDIPFALDGSVTAVPDDTQTNGSVSYTQGWGILYSTAVSSGGLNYPRAQNNQILFDITSAIQAIQQNGCAAFITSVMNNGSAYSYNKGAAVLFDPGGGEQVYISLVANNVTDPTNTSEWAPIGEQSSFFVGGTSTGSANVQAVATTGANFALTNGNLLTVIAGFTNTSSMTLAVDAVSATVVQKITSTGMVALGAGDFVAGGRYLISVNGSVLQLLNPSAARIPFTQASTFYVSLSGNDTTGTGAVGAPWLTVTHAMTVIVNQYDQKGLQATIQLQDTGSLTTYTTGFSGVPSATGPILIQGNTGIPTRVLVNVTSNNAFSFTGGTAYPINLAYMEIHTITSGYGVTTVFGRVGLSNITFGPCAQGYHSASGPGGYIEYDGPITWAGNTSIASQTYQQGQFNGLSATVTTSGTPVWGTAGVLATGCANQYWGGVTFAGSGATGVRYQSNDGAAVQTNGGGANFLPGSSPGTTSQGFYS